jgi:GNAT superfamily N-acetyltransferase
MELVDVTVYYLQMLELQRRHVLSPRQDVGVVHVAAPSAAFYRQLYQAVGGPYHWLSRRKMSDETLAELLADSRNELHILHVADEPAGFAELDRRQPGEIELVQFGLLPGYIGQGLGRWFLQWTIDKAWSYSPRRFWLHTCTLDHPAALPNYQKAGFRLYKQEQIRREL